MSSAVLSNKDGFTVLSVGGTRLRFRAPRSLEYYVRVKQWDNGYLVVDAKYSHLSDPEEEYIDLTPILEDLYIDPEVFLSAIQDVEVSHV